MGDCHRFSTPSLSEVTPPFPPSLKFVFRISPVTSSPWQFHAAVSHRVLRVTVITDMRWTERPRLSDVKVSWNSQVVTDIKWCYLQKDVFMVAVHFRVNRDATELAVGLQAVINSSVSSGLSWFTADERTEHHKCKRLGARRSCSTATGTGLGPICINRGSTNNIPHLAAPLRPGSPWGWPGETPVADSRILTGFTCVWTVVQDGQMGREDHCSCLSASGL